MYNIFDTLPLDLMVVLHHPKHGDFVNNFEILEFYMLKHIFLSHSELPYLYSPKEFRRLMSENINHKNPQEIAEMTMGLCGSYLGYFFQKEATNNKDFHSLAIEVIPSNIVHKFRCDFMQETSIRNELKSLLLMAYFYTDSHSIRRNCIDKYQLQEIIYNIEYIKGSGTAQEIYRKINGFQKNNPPFMNAFLLSTDDVKRNTIRHNGKDSEICFKSFLDIGIMSCIIESASNSKNPFALHDTDSFLLNLPLFLSNCKTLMMTSDKETTIVDNLLKKCDCQYDKKIFFVYDQYLLERLSCINFLYKLYELKKADRLPASTMNILVDFMTMPLLNYRLGLLDFHEKLAKDIVEWDSITLSKWNISLRNDLKYMTCCLIPVLDMVFHYLMTLRYCFDENGEIIKESIHENISRDMMPFFASVVDNPDNAYFSKRDDTIVTTKANPILNKRLDRKLAAFAVDSYLNFYQKMSFLRDRHLYSDNVMQKYQILSSNLMRDVLCFDEEPIISNNV